MPQYLIQPTFSGGEFSPSLYSRVDIQKYSTALKKAKNFIVHPQGGISNRPGLRFIGQSKTPTKKCRVIPFEVSITNAYVIECGEYYFRFYKDGGLILNTGTPVEVAHPYSESELKDIKYVQSNDVLFLVHPNYAPRKLIHTSDTVWSLETFNYTNGPFIQEKRTDAIAVVRNSTGTVHPITPAEGLMHDGYPVLINSTAPMFTTGNVGSLYKFNQIRYSTSFTQTITSNVSTPVIQLLVKGPWRVITRGTWGGTLTILRSRTDNYTGRDVVRTFAHNSVDYNLDVTGIEDNPCLLSIGMDGWGGGTCYVDVSHDAVEIQGIAKATEYVSDISMKGVVVGQMSAYDEVVTWQEGSWSDRRGYPTCAVFYQDRLVFGATKSEPQVSWCSKTGEYTNFGVSSPLLDSDAITRNLPSRKTNEIKNLISLKDIVAFTSSSEWKLGASGDVLTPTTATQNLQENIGSSSCEPVLIGNRAIFVSPMGTVVRDIGYDYSVDGFVGGNLSLFSTHLFDGYSVTEAAYQQEPDSIIWFVRSDGKALALTYMREQQVLAWTWNDTDGLFESVCSIPGTGQNDVYFVINRGGKRYIEKMGKRLTSSDPADCFFVDSGLSYSGTPISTVSGLTHLEGKTVTVLADGYVLSNKVVSSGSISLGASYSKITVGLPYVSDVETMNIEMQLQDGISYGRYMKVSEARFSFLNSRGGFIGGNENNLDPIIQIGGVTLGDPQALFSGDFIQPINASFDEGGRVFFRQSDPLPVTILAIMPKVAFGG